MSENNNQNAEPSASPQINKPKRQYTKKKTYPLTSAGLIPNLITKEKVAKLSEVSALPCVSAVQCISKPTKLPLANAGKELVCKTPSPLIVGDKPVPAKRATQRSSKPKQDNRQRKTPVKIISLGGLHEIGKNLTVYECCNDIVMVDCGLSFPDDELLGIDLVLPDFTYLEKNKDKIRGLVITHGHEDHIGAIPYFLKKVNVPVYGTKLTLGILEGKLKEHGLLATTQLNVVSPGSTIKLGCMAVEFIEVNHSIPDACGLALFTPAGIIVHTGDFKIDYTPILGNCIDLARFGELGSRGVLALLPDSTNADKPGSSMSERTVAASFDGLFRNAGGKRILIATFASNVHRIQTIFEYAQTHGRKVAVSGRSMENVVAKATELGYLTYPEGMLIDIDAIKNYPDDKLVIITTGSQGEPMSALARMSSNDHRKITITPNDCIIISAQAIPGNEKLVNRLINDLMKLGADVLYDKVYNLHVSGHACQEDLKLMMKLTKPKYVIPLHGEFKHLKKQKDLAISMGIPENNVIISDIGKVIETDGVDMKITGSVPAGRVMVDGLGVGDVGSIVLRDRKHLAEDGLIVVVAAIDSASGELVSGPDVVSRGFVYVRESEQMMSEAREVCLRALSQCQMTGFKDWNTIKQTVKDQLGQYLYVQTKRSPMILPIIQEI
ncbi:MAG: ribonuclease J [Oscillospiraceae bacterium]